MAQRRSPKQEKRLFSPALPGDTLAARRRRALFLPRQLADEVRKQVHLHEAAFCRAHEIFVRWADLESQGGLAAKETSLDAEFLQQIFGDALGYAPITAASGRFQLARQFHVPDVGQADGAIGDFSADEKRSPVAVIELKAADVHLDTDRFNGRTPVQQLWDYLNGLPECPWGIVSNFVSFRLYHRARGSRTFEHFTLQELRDPERFKTFFCIFGPGGLLPTKLQRQPRAELLLQRAGERQREVGDDLYDAYSQNRLALIEHLHRRMGKTLERAIAIAQKLMDRIVFIAFCEDRALLPPRVIDETYEKIPPLARVTNPRWRNFLDLFHAVDQGHPEFGLNGGYNGGLFRFDDEVDNLDLPDQWTNFFRSVGRYDFRDEINVDVLGHLFEKSVTELEKLRAGGLFADAPSGETRTARMPKSAKRKRFGIYYTPPEFTTFIVENAVGAVIDERLLPVAREFGFESLLPPGEQPREVLQAYWRKCFDVLCRLRICDPACGSGAFLISAYEYLEGRYTEIVDNLTLAGHPDAPELAERIPDLILADNLFGVDLQWEAVEITQLALWLRSARRGRTLADLSQNVLCGNSLVADRDAHPRALAWEAAFPQVFENGGGFDCVIGNPPWERVKLQEREHFALSAPKIASAVSAADRRRLIAALERSDPDLHARYVEAQTRAERTLDYARASGRYPLVGKGDINTYALFAELARSIVAPNGRVGLLVPSGIASDKTTKDFFARLMDDQSLVLLYDFENREKIFQDVDSRFKFCTLIFGGSACRNPAADFVFFAHSMEDLRESKRHIALSAADLKLVNPNTRTCPIFRTRRDAELTKAIYRRIPVLIDRNRKAGGNPWGIRFFTMFHQTNDAELFHTAEQLRAMRFKPDGNRWVYRKRTFLPLYEAKMVQAYDHRAASVVVDETNWMRQGQTDATSLVAHQNPECTAQPRWWVDEQVVAKALGGDDRPAYLCYKDVTSPTNERTMIASFIPRAGVVNSAPLVLCDKDLPARSQCGLLANLNSFIYDYVARQKVGNIHLNFFIVEQLPTLPPDAYEEACPWNPRQKLGKWVSDRVLKLTCTADDMRPLAEACGFGPGVHKWKGPERARLRAELDAAYFLLYGIARDDVAYILSTFSGTQRRDEGEVGTYRTAEAILAAYDALRASK